MKAYIAARYGTVNALAHSNSTGWLKFSFIKKKIAIWRFRYNKFMQ